MTWAGLLHALPDSGVGREQTRVTLLDHITWLELEGRPGLSSWIKVARLTSHPYLVRVEVRAAVWRRKWCLHESEYTQEAGHEGGQRRLGALALAGLCIRGQVTYTLGLSHPA